MFLLEGKQSKKKTDDGVIEKGGPRTCYWKVSLTIIKHYSKKEVLRPSPMALWHMDGHFKLVRYQPPHTYIRTFCSIVPLFCYDLHVEYSIWPDWVLVFNYAKLSRLNDSANGSSPSHIFVFSRVVFLNKNMLLFWNSSITVLLTHFSLLLSLGGAL